MSLIGRAEYAASRKARGLPGGSKQAVGRAVNSGRITLTNGLLDPEQADREWERNTSLAQQQRALGKGAGRSEDPDEDGETKNQAETRKEIALANLRELEEAEKRGSLVELKRFTDTLSGFVSNTKSRLLGIGSKLAPELAIETEEPKIKAMIDAEVSEALTELTRWEPAA